MKELDARNKPRILWLSKPEKDKKGITYVKKLHGKLI